jgi:energy-converting hydrogenase Eha subunit F
MGRSVDGFRCVLALLESSFLFYVHILFSWVAFVGFRC